MDFAIGHLAEQKGENKMSDKRNNDEEKTKKREKSALFQATRKVLLAGIGALSLAQDEVEEFVDHLVSRGEIAEKDGKKLVREMLDKRKENFKKAETESGKHLEELLGRMNIPTRAEVNALAEQLSALSKKLDEFEKKE